MQRPQPHRWWLITGLISFILIFLSSFGRDLSGGLGELAFSFVDWLAASVIYFFLGALVGHFIDRWLARKRKQSISNPCWFWATLALWLLGTVVAFIYGDPASGANSVLYLFFPIIYGVFFTSFAFEVILRPWSASLVARTLFDFVFIGAFFGWLVLSVKLLRESVLKQWQRILRRALLIIVMLTLTVGAVSCATQIA